MQDDGGRAGSEAQSGEIVFACIAPHGDLAIAEACPPERANLAVATQTAMGELARRLEVAEPDVVVVLTPHGIHVEGHFAVVVAGHLVGALEEAPAIALALAADRELGLAVVSEMRLAGLPVVGVSFGGNDPAEAAMPLDWGSLIPLWHLGGRREPPLPVVVIAPARDLAPDRHIEAGAALARAVARTGRRAAVVASADQAHTHDASGPYGFNPAAALHDELVVQLLREGAFARVRDIEPHLIEAAKPDSWWQHLMLLGAIGEAWRPEVLSYEAPTYFGMLCAAFTPPAGDSS